MLKLRLPSRKLTLVGKSYLFLACLTCINLICWVAAIALFAPDQRKRRVLALCTVAWTLGLRHALDADHISAIDNATRQLVARGRRPITCGLFFSLGHSTIVITVTLAIAISVGVADHLSGVSSVGGVIGVSVSASFLLILAIINSFILHRVLKERKRILRGEYEASEPRPAFGIIARAVRPLLRLIDRPWKLYPIGILFGFGFDTASEISLLGISALATRPEAGGIASSEILILPALFTAGMSLVDSIDSVIMLWGYAMPEPGEEHWKRIWRKDEVPPATPATELPLAVLPSTAPDADKDVAEAVSDDQKADKMASEPEPSLPVGLKQKRLSVYMDLSVVLTLISIFVAFAISLIQFMGLALEKCASCAEAAENDPGHSGRWWRFWATMNDNSGYVGAAIVGVMVLCGVVFVFGRKYQAKKAVKRAAQSADPVVEEAVDDSKV